MVFEKVTLEGNHVRLEPLSKVHRGELIEAISDGELWNLFVTLVPRIEDVDEFIESAISAHESGDGLAFATIDKISGRVIGSTRFMKANLQNKRVEIGFTFIAKSYQKTKMNTEAKLLMFTHAFEVLSLNRVELLTDYLNTTSRSAILRLGAKEEGILRNHMVMPDGRVRDSVMFSVTNHEWAGVKQNLLFKLATK
ncbi:RimJ/RimL family protein N-acetyltransferase [Sinobacterium caligoides]|uniref:RimJ/RimL family protein N-acetyltransferase n=1 Tax=Sinobacterium caligoides TaxID=933926 RepID=A0A3N2E0F7_9GAMM|nr:GNAT family protein [Sinobacterium caligoides]ROS05593.1 RimJ/RimL family protein N-acetyltransferase [Sinobacterium caligoides]